MQPTHLPHHLRLRLDSGGPAVALLHLQLMMAMALVGGEQELPAITVDNDGDHPKGLSDGSFSITVTNPQNGLCLYRPQRPFSGMELRYLLS